MAVNLSPVGGAAAQFFTNTGAVLTGGKLYTYAAGTTTPVAAYTTSAGSTAWTNPIVLDSAGRVPSGGEIWITENVIYKFVLKDSNDTLIATYDNISGISSGLLTFETNLAAGTGSSLVGFIQSGTGATATTVQAKLRQTVSVADFGAVGNGTTDDTTAIQNAINALTTTGGTLYFPAGTYKITSTLTFRNPNNARMSGIMFQGQGEQSTKLVGYQGSGPILSVRGVPSSGTFSTTFFWGGGIQDMTLDGSNASASTNGLDVLGWWYPTFKNVTFNAQKGHGIRQYCDLSVVTNPDFSSTNGAYFYNCTFQNITGWGCMSDDGVTYGTSTSKGCIGASDWVFENTVWNACAIGGIYVLSSGWNLHQCSIAVSGYSGSGGGATGGGGAVLGNQAITGTWYGAKFEECELDGNNLFSVQFNGCQTVEFYRCRTIHRPWPTASSQQSPVNAYVFAATSGSDTAKGIKFFDMVTRIDPRTGSATVNGFNWVNTANVYDITVDGHLVSDNTSGGVTYNEFVGQTASNNNARQHYRLRTDSNVALPGQLQSPGMPPPMYIGTISGSPSVATGTQAIVKFDSPDSVIAQLFTSPNNYYNVSTGVFTVPFAAFYSIDVSLSVTGLTATDLLQTYLYINNSSVYDEVDSIGNSVAPRFTSILKYSGWFAAGTTIDFRAICSNARSISGGNSQLVIKMINN